MKTDPHPFIQTLTRRGFIGKIIGGIATLIGAALFIPLVYLDHFEATVVFGTFLISFILMVIITGVTGFTRLVGAGYE